MPLTQLLLYEFGPDTHFEGGVLGALERIESGGAIRLRDALFVGTDAKTGELLAVDLRDGAAGLLLFRLDPAERRRVTERTLASGTSGVPADTIREVARALKPGSALVAVLVEHRWARAMEDTVSRTGGVQLANGFVEATALAELAPDLLAAAEGTERP
jgi:hypothetical protein